MSGEAQAPERGFFWALAASGARLALLFAAFSAISGCAAGAFSLKDAEVDRTFYTSDIPAEAKRTPDAARLSDEQTIRNAVSSADIVDLGGRDIAWANAETGARGAISGVKEFNEDRILCRSFVTTRESFDGVGLFRGKACTVTSGVWYMQSFEAA